MVGHTEHTASNNSNGVNSNKHNSKINDSLLLTLELNVTEVVQGTFNQCDLHSYV